ncbi:hypothetical protein [Fodinicola feengrottensis]|uniref:hypothetical protein n=1 Tax=Fodinicola feengrottensis TaxID=435914 RepID=UPI0013D3F12D|nr:hypothetical protein [Fodinicola feengrottensis]
MACPAASDSAFAGPLQGITAFLLDGPLPFGQLPLGLGALGGKSGLVVLLGRVGTPLSGADNLIGAGLGTILDPLCVGDLLGRVVRGQLQDLFDPHPEARVRHFATAGGRVPAPVQRLDLGLLGLRRESFHLCQGVVALGREGRDAAIQVSYERVDLPGVVSAQHPLEIDRGGAGKAKYIASAMALRGHAPILT